MFVYPPHPFMYSHTQITHCLIIVPRWLQVIEGSQRKKKQEDLVGFLEEKREKSERWRRQYPSRSTLSRAAMSKQCRFVAYEIFSFHCPTPISISYVALS